VSSAGAAAARWRQRRRNKQRRNGVSEMASSANGGNIIGWQSAQRKRENNVGMK
jgi:hypothetical protein